MKSRLEPAHEPWMRTNEVCAVMEALTGMGGEARFVGGAVRNALLDRAIDDIDIATPLLPDEVTRRLQRAKIAALPTGVEHGTVTAVLNGRVLEVTTLRRDVSTDGRRAVVSFSDNWEEDAARRDFTINALYASFDGKLFDYNGGLADLASGRIRFIGDPVQRIREDYLRILRLFRFHAWYGRGDIDGAALAAAAAEREGMRILSGERIHKELLRLLEAENPIPVLHAMKQQKILEEILRGDADLDQLERLVGIDNDNFFRPDPLLRLAIVASIRGDPARVQTMTERLKLSNEERDRLLALAITDVRPNPYLPVRDVRQILYRMGKARFRDRVMLAWAGDAKQSNTIAWRALLALTDAWERPRFPLTGREVMAAGVPEGPLVGRVLSEVENWWVEHDFTEDARSLDERLKIAVQGLRE
jgi:poly(A) polymerase